MNLPQDKLIMMKFADDEFTTGQIYYDKIYLG